MVDPFFAQSSPAKRKRTRPSTPGRPKPAGGVGGKTAAGKRAAGAKSDKGRDKGKRREVTSDDQVEGYESDEAGEGGAFDSDDEDIASDDAEVYSEDEDDDDQETPAQKRLRLAKAYLQDLKEAQRREEGEANAARLDKELISARLQQDVLEKTGRMHDFVGARLPPPAMFSIFRTGRNHHRLPITSAAVSPDGAYLYAAGKEGSIVKYDLSALWRATAPIDNSMRKTAIMGRVAPRAVPKGDKKGKGRANPSAPGVSQATEAQHGHVGEVLTIAVSGDGTILASGGKDRLVGVWDISGEGAKWRGGLRGHKDTIASVAFRLGTSSLFTSSYDRTLKIFELASLSYSETLFGHQDKISHISALRNELAVSAGGRDRTCRYWKVAEESQLVFRGGGQSKVRDLLEGAALDDDDDEEEQTQPRVVNGRNRKRTADGPGQRHVEGSIDCVAMVDDQTFLSGGDSGTIALWSTAKKKPTFTVPIAHGLDGAPEGADVGGSAKPRWITAIACLPYGDLFASGSWEGQVRLWRIAEDKRSFSALGELGVAGCINSLQVLKLRIAVDRSGQRKKTEKVAVVVGVGQEPRLGRWMRLKDARNGVVVATAELQSPAPAVANGFH